MDIDANGQGVVKALLQKGEQQEKSDKRTGGEDMSEGFFSRGFRVRLGRHRRRHRA